MAYKIAVASTDGSQVDRTFGAAEKFLIFEVEDGKPKHVETRAASDAVEINPAECPSKESRESGCAGGCGTGCGDNGTQPQKVSLLSDCRCVVCEKIGFPIRKQFERLAISVFDVSCSVEEALQKITAYYDRLDRHESLRQSAT